MRKRLFSFLLSAVLVMGNIVPVMAAPEYADENVEIDETYDRAGKFAGDVEIEHPVDDIVYKCVELTDDEVAEYLEQYAGEDEEAAGSAVYDSKWDSYASYYVYNQLT